MKPKSRPPVLSSPVIAVQRLGRVPLLLILGFGTSGMTVPCQGQTLATPLTERSAPSEEEIQAELDHLADEHDLTEEDRTEIRKLLTRAQRNRKRIESLVSSRLQFQSQVRDAAAKLEISRKRLQELQSPPVRPVVPIDTPMVALEQELTRLEGELKVAQQRRIELDAEPQRRAVRLQEIATETETIKNELEATRARLSVNGVEVGSTPMSRAKRLLDQSNLPVLERRLELLQSEADAYRATVELLQVERDLALAEHARLDAQTTTWRELIVERRQREAKQKAHQAQLKALLTSPELSELAEQVSALAEQRSNLADESAKENQRLTQSKNRANELTSAFNSVQQRVGAGLSDAGGQILRRDRRAIPDVRPYLNAIQERRKKIEDASFLEYEYDDRRLAMTNLDAVAEHWAGKMDPPPNEEMRTELRNLLQSQLESLEGVQAEVVKYKNLLLELNAVEQQLIDTATKYANYIDERVLWIRSTHPLSMKDGRQMWSASRWLVDPIHWREAGVALADNAKRSLWTTIPGVLLLLALVYAQKPARRALGRIGRAVERKGSTAFVPTIQALALTAIISCMWPAILAILARWWLSMRADSEFDRAMPMGVVWAAIAWLPLEFIRQTCRPLGLALSHFHWPAETCAIIRRCLRWINRLGFPLLLVCITTEYIASKPLWGSSLGRLAFMIILVLATIFLYFVLYSRQGVLAQLGVYRPESGLYRLRHLWSYALLAAPGALFLLSFAGYYDTAKALGVRLYLSLTMIFLLAVANACSVRWILLRRRRLAMEQLRQRRAAELSEPRAVSESPGMSVTLEVTDEVDLADATRQSRKLVGIVYVLLGAILLWLIWNDVIPALKILQQYPAWPGAVLTIADVLKAILAASVTAVATRNVAGLLELTLLDHLPVDRGARYATTSLCRYTVLTIGLVMTARFLGIQWASVQWLVAAMGIGLGFGLQEIFANFVSGVVLLFERPIRVGDVVTLGETTGVVTRIRIRATTIRDWDRKEFVVPNKDLITGRLLNWTLSDLTNRILIKVGISYSSDVAQAREILLQVAAEHPVVLDDPPPSAVLDSFGDSALSLTLRCFLPDLELRLPTIHELHATILQRFRAAGIQIPYPQRDVYLHRVQEDAA